MEIEAEPESGWKSPGTSSRSYRNSALIYFGEESFANNVYSGSKSNQRENGADKPFYMRKALNGSIAQSKTQPLPLGWGSCAFYGE